MIYGGGLSTMQWNKLRVFYYVAQSGSFTRAAEVLHVCQSAVSRQIIELEKNIKSKLFKRHLKGLKLTKQGEILFSSVKKMFFEANKAQTLIQEEKDEPQGLLRITATAGFASLYLSKYIPGFLSKYPQMQISLFASDSDPFINMEDDDIVIRPFIHSNALGIIQKHLITFHLGLYASQQYLGKFGVPKNPEDLDNHRLIAFGNHSNSPFVDLDWHLKVGIKKGKI